MQEKQNKVYIATVGSSKEPVLRGLLYSTPDIAYLLYSPNPQHEKNPELVAKMVKEESKPFGLTKCHLRRIDAFSLESVITEFISIWQKHRNDRITANMTGGTNIMASACLLAGFTASAEVIYVRQLQNGEDVPIKEQVIVLPTPSIPLTQVSDQQRAILLELLRAIRFGESIYWKANSRMSNCLGISGQTVTHHLKKLKKHGLIKIERRGRELGLQLSSSGLLFARMLEKLNE